jgi:hypothetical protein
MVDHVHCFMAEPSEEGTPIRMPSWFQWHEGVENGFQAGLLGDDDQGDECEEPKEHRSALTRPRVSPIGRDLRRCTLPIRPSHS